MLLSLFSGCGGLDLGFEQAGYSTGLAYDIRPQSIRSWNGNRLKNQAGRVRDINTLTLEQLDIDFNGKFTPSGVIGGPPCQSFTNANSHKRDDDPRALLVAAFFDTAVQLHRRSPLDFIVMENVPELASPRYCKILDAQIARLDDEGFICHQEVLDAYDYGVPQHRRRLILVALHKEKFAGATWVAPEKSARRKNVKHAISALPEPSYFARGLLPEDINHHPNHWCMVPKSSKFRDGRLTAGKGFGRSFKMLRWDKPSFTVSYGNREVHVHPHGNRRLSVFEAMLLQGFPKSFVLEGTLSAQITQVSEAVPPPLARKVAESILLMSAPEARPECIQPVGAAPAFLQEAPHFPAH